MHFSTYRILLSLLTSSSDYFQPERNIIIVTVSLLIMNKYDVRWVHSQKENHHYDHISFNLKVIINLFIRVYLNMFALQSLATIELFICFPETCRSLAGI